jgi:predicted secreted protein
VAKKLGIDYRLWIESATPGTYNMIKGNTTLSYEASGETVDTSSKDDYPWRTRAAGMRDLTVNFEIVPDLPDANGYTRFETQANLTSADAGQLPDPQERRFGRLSGRRRARRIVLHHRRAQPEHERQRGGQGDRLARRGRRADHVRAGVR